MDIHQHWKDLDRTVSAAISAGQIGTPRALRVTLYTSEENCDPDRLNNEVTRSLGSWFSTDPVEVSSPAKNRKPTVVLAKWKSGAMALISISTGSHGYTGGDLTLLGSKGAIFHRIPGVAR